MHRLRWAVPFLSRSSESSLNGYADMMFAESPMQNLVESPQILKYMECKEFLRMSWLLTMERKVRILKRGRQRCYYLVITLFSLHCILIIQ